MTKQIAPGIFMITQTMDRKFMKFSANIFVLAGQNGLLFDSGLGNPRSGRSLASKIRAVEKQATLKLGKPCKVTRVLPSHGHWDHFSGIENLRTNLGLKVVLTRKMIDKVTSKSNLIKSMDQDDGVSNSLHSFFRRLRSELLLRLCKVMFVTGAYDIIEENKALRINGNLWEIIALPGHCDDDIVLYNRDRGILLGGDIVLKNITTWLGPPRSDLDAYMKSLKFLLALPGLSLILPGHGSPIKNPKTRISELIAHREKRTMQVYTIIRDTDPGGVSFDLIYKAIYPSARFRDQYLSKGWIQTTLSYLIRKEMISESITGTYSCYNRGCSGNQKGIKACPF